MYKRQFVFWGFLHGLALIINRLWDKTSFRLNKVVAWILTFNFVNAAWVFFRASNFDDALKVLKGMVGFKGILISPNLAGNPVWEKLTAIGVRFGSWHQNLPREETYVYFLCILLIPFVLFMKNSSQLLDNFSPAWKSALATAFMIACGLLLLNQSSVFLYFKF